MMVEDDDYIDAVRSIVENQVRPLRSTPCHQRGTNFPAAFRGHEDAL